MSAIYQVIEKESKKEQNFYSTSLPQALAWAKDSKRQMKALTGKDYEVVVKTSDNQILSLKDYDDTLGRKTN
tara:strand:+ start:377 stop:592 length:216 start_codon:yes stop_codon:yes gene_type:complete